MTATEYLIKALDNYPCYPEETMESLNYALSFDGNNAVALCLMGRVHYDLFRDATTAIDYFEQALASDLRYSETYIYYMDVLIETEDLAKARKFVEFTRKKIPHLKAFLCYSEARIFEREQKFKKALKCLSEALIHSYSCDFISDIDRMKSRIERKQK